ncbi:hypothetical protein HDU76_003129 [Blyttiomyces sp. JEL0837]|nr:hypothetical protein HDU76_003129 [Blyttiomyces sp. JEL0837]
MSTNKPSGSVEDPKGKSNTNNDKEPHQLVLHPHIEYNGQLGTTSATNHDPSNMMMMDYGDDGDDGDDLSQDDEQGGAGGGSDTAGGKSADGSVMGGGGVVHSTVGTLSIANHSAFISKLYQMLQEADPTMISWDTSGTFFIVGKPTEFARHVLPMYFKHNNFASFVRQLNMYGFHKISDAFYKLAGSSELWEFKHPYFRRGELSLLQKIKRKTPKTTSRGKSATADISPDHGGGGGGGGFGGAIHGGGSGIGIGPSISNARLTIDRPRVPIDSRDPDDLLQRTNELDEKLAKLHESYDILWQETVSCRLLQSKHHQLITNMTSFLASIYKEEAGKRKFDVDILQAEVAKIMDTPSVLTAPSPFLTRGPPPREFPHAEAGQMTRYNPYPVVQSASDPQLIPNSAPIAVPIGHGHNVPSTSGGTIAMPGTTSVTATTAFDPTFPLPSSSSSSSQHYHHPMYYQQPPHPQPGLSHPQQQQQIPHGIVPGYDPHGYQRHDYHPHVGYPGYPPPMPPPHPQQQQQQDMHHYQQQQQYHNPYHPYHQQHQSTNYQQQQSSSSPQDQNNTATSTNSTTGGITCDTTSLNRPDPSNNKKILSNEPDSAVELSHPPHDKLDTTTTSPIHSHSHSHSLRPVRGGTTSETSKGKERVMPTRGSSSSTSTTRKDGGGVGGLRIEYGSGGNKSNLKGKSNGRYGNKRGGGDDDDDDDYVDEEIVEAEEGQLVQEEEEVEEVEEEEEIASGVVASVGRGGGGIGKGNNVFNNTRSSMGMGMGLRSRSGSGSIVQVGVGSKRKEISRGNSGNSPPSLKNVGVGTTTRVTRSGGGVGVPVAAMVDEGRNAKKKRGGR